MATLGGVKRAQRCDGAPAKWEISWIGVVIRACEGAEVESGAGKDAIAEIMSETWIFFVEWAKVINVVGEEIRCPSCKAG